MGYVHRIAEEDEDIPYRTLTPAGLASLSEKVLGEKNSNVRLTAAQVRAIRIDIANGVRSGVLAAQYNVTKNAIKDIRRGRTWSHLK